MDICSNPDGIRRLFLLDGSGALLSAGCLGLLLPAFPAFFGMPVSVLPWLTLGAVLLGSYAFMFFFFGGNSRSKLLRFSALGNGLYCLVSIAVLIVHASSLQWAGWLYFIGELGIVACFAVLEWRVSSAEHI